MAKIYSSDKVWEILQELAEPVIMRRNAFPYLLQNHSGQVLHYTNERDGNHFEGQVAPGEYLVVQPQGEFHKTNPALHDLAGVTPNTFTPRDETSARAAAGTAAFTEPAQVQHAIDQLCATNPGLSAAQLTLCGWCPSTSRIRGYRIPSDLNGIIMLQPQWGAGMEQRLDSKRDVIVAVEGQEGDCYANPKADFADWVSVVQPELAGDALVKSLPTVTQRQLSPGISWQENIDRSHQRRHPPKRTAPLDGVKPAIEGVIDEVQNKHQHHRR